MKTQVFISIFLDTRRTKANGLYPVKLRVFTSKPRIQKLYPTKFEFSEKDFKSIWETTKPREEHRNSRKELQAIESKANQIADKLAPFTFEQFERKMLSKVGESDGVFNHYEEVISQLKKNKQIGTASNYDLSLKSLKSFLLHKTDREAKHLLFQEITVNWLNEYEQFMLNIRGLSRTTVGIYLRPLKAIFNRAISNKEIELDIYPFGRRKYQIPAGKAVKKALSHADLSKLFHALPKTPQQERAKAFWFLSYSCNGMNIKDIALLRYENIKDDYLVFHRAKTINTSKTNLKQVTLPLQKEAKKVIKQYGTPKTSEKDLIFSIVSDEMTEEIKYKKIQNFIRFINQNLKKLAIENNLTGDISTYWARHSYATNAIRHGASMEYVGEAFGHSNMKTTQAYFAGFESKKKNELSRKMMDFATGTKSAIK